MITNKSNEYYEKKRELNNGNSIPNRKEGVDFGLTTKHIASHFQSRPGGRKGREKEANIWEEPHFFKHHFFQMVSLFEWMENCLDTRKRDNV